MADVFHCPEHGCPLEDEAFSMWCPEGQHTVPYVVLAGEIEFARVREYQTLAEAWRYLRNLAEPA